MDVDARLVAESSEFAVVYAEALAGLERVGPESATEKSRIETRELKFVVDVSRDSFVDAVEGGAEDEIADSRAAEEQ